MDGGSWGTRLLVSLVPQAYSTYCTGPVLSMVRNSVPFEIQGHLTCSAPFFFLENTLFSGRLCNYGWLLENKCWVAGNDHQPYPFIAAGRETQGLAV